MPIQLAQCRFPRLAISNAKNKYIFFQIKYTKAILSKNTRKLLWFEITKMLIVVLKNKSLVSFITICGTLSFPIRDVICGVIIVSVCSYTELQTTLNCVIVAPYVVLRDAHNETL